MTKQAVTQRETQVATESGVGKQLEQTITLDDNFLPSPQELAAYGEVNPDIVKYIMDSTSKEQEHRHRMEVGKLRLLTKSESRVSWMNWWGMFFAFLSIFITIGLAAFALYLDKPWFAWVCVFTSLVPIVSIFVTKKPQAKEKSKK